MNPPPYSLITSSGRLPRHADLARRHVRNSDWHGAPRSLDVDAHQAERLDGRWPQVEDVAGWARLRVPLDQQDVMAGLVDRQGRGHPPGTAPDDGDAAVGYRRPFMPPSAAAGWIVSWSCHSGQAWAVSGSMLMKS